MNLRIIQAGLVLVLTACGAAPERGSAGRSRRSPPRHGRDVQFPLGDDLFAWRVYGAGYRKGGADLAYRRRQRTEAAGRRRPARGAGSQGGLLDIQVSPDFATEPIRYLTYSEPSANGGSGLALARAQLSPDGSRLYGPPFTVARPSWRAGRPVRRDRRLRAGRQVAVPDIRRAPAFHPCAGSQPAARQDPPPHARREAGGGQSDGRAHWRFLRHPH